MIAISLIAAAGCREASTAERESRTVLTGHVVYQDAQTDADGNHHDADVLAGASGTLRMMVHGNGSIAGTCADAPTGAFVAYYDADVRIDSAGAFSAPLYPAAPAIYTASGCAVDELTVGAVTNVSISAAVRATPQRCAALCTATARARGEGDCSLSDDPAACRRSVQPASAADCADRCASQAAAIGGQGALDNNALPYVDADNLRQGNFGEISATLVFDRLYDDQLQVVR